MFKYYLPHLSDRHVDFYADCMHSSVDMRTNEAFEQIEMERAKELHLPCIDDGDFEYYPRSSAGGEWNSAYLRSSDEDGAEPEIPQTATERASTADETRNFRKRRWISRFLRSLKCIVSRSSSY
jgi:hypothetical protein